MTEQFDRPSPEDIEACSDEIAAMLHGRGPMLQGAALADIVARFFAAHNPDIREESLDVWVDHMRQLIEPNEEELIARFGGSPWERTNN